MSYMNDPYSTRELRHAARARFAHIVDDLSGMPGLTQEQAVEHAGHIIDVAEEGLNILREILTRLETRDWEAHQAAKAKWRADQAETAGLEASVAATDLDQALNNVLAMLGLNPGDQAVTDAEDALGVPHN